MVSNLAKFTHNLPEATVRIRCPLKDDSEFLWDGAQDSAFKDMKMLIASAGTLPYFDTGKSVTLGLKLPNKASVRCYYRIVNLLRIRQNPSSPPNKNICANREGDVCNCVRKCAIPLVYLRQTCRSHNLS